MRRFLERHPHVGQRILVFLIEDVGFSSYLIAFGLLVTLLGMIYSFLTPHGHGVGKDGIALSDMTFLKGLYFSIVTISSLGYGDMHPMGWSKTFACLEVFLGLALMGIMIAKVTSRRLSYHVLRLFSSDAQKRLEEFSSQFEVLGTGLADAMKALGRVYQNTPGEGVREDKAAGLLSFKNALAALQSKCAGLADYLSLEVEQSDYFDATPVDAVRRVGESADKAFLILGQLIISLSPEARTDALDRENRQRISEAIDSQKTTCQLVQQHCWDEGTKNRFLRILETCERVPESYFSMPAELAVAEQPDQILEGTDEPQEPSLGNKQEHPGENNHRQKRE